MQSLIACTLQKIVSASGGNLPAGIQLSEVRPGATHLPTRKILNFGADKVSKIVVLFNPTGRSRTTQLLQAVDSSTVCVRNADGTLLPAQVNPLYSNDLLTKQPGFELVTPIEVPPFAVKVVEVVRDPSCKVTMASVWQSKGGAVSNFPEGSDGSSATLQNSHVVATFRNGLLETMRPAIDGSASSTVREAFFKYQTSKSGAYIFVPNGEPTSVAVDTVRHISGPFISSMHVIVQEGGGGRTILARSARLASNDLGVKMSHYVDITAQSNEEWIVRYDTNLNTDRTLYTELNGWTSDRHKIRDGPRIPLQTKYFPLPAGAFIEDVKDHRRLSIQSAQPCGVGSMKESSVEVMLDRRLTRDDARGMNEVSGCVCVADMVATSNAAPLMSTLCLRYPCLQAMNDNLPTRNALVLTIGNANGVDDRTFAAEGGRPTLASLIAAEELNRPIVHLVQQDDAVVTFNAPRVIATLQKLGAPQWPCDLSLDALKPGRRISTGVRARLARRSFDSRFPAPASCTSLKSSELWVDTSQLFTATPSASTGVTALTLGGAVDKASAARARSVYLPPMEWATFEWDWPSRVQPPPNVACGGSPVSIAAASSDASSSGCTFEENTDLNPGR
jgi:hypothetical protein